MESVYILIPFWQSRLLLVILVHAWLWRPLVDLVELFKFVRMSYVIQVLRVGFNPQLLLLLVWL